MNAATKAPEIPTDARERAEWIKWQLALRELTLADVARAAKVARALVSDSIRYRRSGRVESVVAEKLGIPACQIWPERYDANGERIDFRRRPKTEGEADS